MNKFITKITSLALGAAMMIGVGVAVSTGRKDMSPAQAADQLAYTLTFGTGTNSSTAVSTSTTAASTMSGGTDYVTSTPYTNLSGIVYKSGTSNALKIGKSGSSASVTLALSTSGQVKATKIVINARNIGGSKNKGATINVNSLGAQTSNDSTFTDMTYTYSSATSITGITIASNKSVYVNTVKVYAAGSTPLSSITLGGAASSNAMSIGSSDLTAKTVSVTLNPSGATDQKVNIAHHSGTSGLFTVSSSATCTSGSGSFTVAGKGSTSGTETFRISGNTETSVYVDLVVTALDDSVTYWTVSFDSDGGASVADMSVEDGDTFEFPSPGTKTHYSFDGWSSDGGNTLYDTGEESPAVDDDIEYTAYWTQDAQTTVIYKSGDGTGSDISSTEYAGSYSLASFPGTWTAPSGKAFSKWSDGSSQYSAGANYTLVGNTTVTFTAVYKAVDEYILFSGDLVEGDYVIYSDGVALKNSIASNRAEYTSVSPSNNKIIDPDNSIVWSIQKSGEESWLVVSKDDGKYLAGNGTKNQIGLFDDTSADRTWSISGPTDGAYSLVSNRNNSASVNDTLRRNGTYGFACYGSGTGTGISLYKAPSNELDHVTTSGQTTSFTAGNTFSYGGTLTAHYTLDDVATVTPTSYKYGGSGIDPTTAGTAITTSTTLTKAEHDGKYIYVIYTEDEITKYCSYQITVNYAAVTSVEIDTHAAKIGLNKTYDYTSVGVTVKSSYADQGYEWIVHANTVGDDYTFDGSGLKSKDTEGTITLWCRSTADNSKYDELVVTITGDPTAEFTPASVSGYVGKGTSVAFTYGNMDDTSKISISSNNASVTVGAITASAGEGGVAITFVSAGSATLSVSYDGGSTLDSITVTVSTDSVTALTWSAPTIKVYSGATTTASDASSWNVHYTMASGDYGSLVYGEYTLKLGGSAITLPHTWDASEDGKVLSIEYGGFASPTTSTVNVTQTLRAVMAPVEGEPTTSTLTFTEKYATGGATSSGGEEWVVESDGTESNFDDTKGIHYGTGSAAVQYIKLTTDDFASGTITKVVVNASTASGVSATAGVTVGGDQFGGDPQSLSSSATNYTFTGSAAADEIVVTITKPSSATKAIYCLSVAVTYVESSGTQNIANVAGHEAAQKAVVAFAKAMNAAFDNTTNCTEGVAAAWTTASNAYSSNIANNASLSADEKAYAKNLIKYASAQYTDDTDTDYSYCLERAMATYEACIQKHGQTGFMTDVRSISPSSKITSLSLLNNGNSNTVAIIVVISIISISCIGGFFFLRKRKEI